jgi:anti-sigma factor RsiW/polyhydroxyalkanoate synthesis regulator phasin
MKAHAFDPEEVMACYDGALDAARAAEVKAHLGECAECRALAAEFEQVSQRMAEWRVAPPSPGMGARVLAALPEPRRRVRRPLFAVACLAAVLLMVSIPNLLRSRRGETPMTHPIHDRFVGPIADLPAGSSAQAQRESDRMSATGYLGATQPPKPMLVRTASLTLTAKDFENARAAIDALVRKHQGYLGTLQTGKSGEARTLDVSLHIPSDRLDAALTDLKTLGHVEQETRGSEEVSRQHTDFAARLSNARTTERRLAKILEERTGKIADVLAVEQEIMRVRGEIEKLEGQVRDLEKRVQYAAIHVRLAEQYQAEVSLPPSSIGNRLWNAAVEGYRDLRDSLLAGAEFTLRAGPTVLFWTILVFFPARWLWRHRRGSLPGWEN